jgi:ubiquinone/menaquinone biosynthesis C-methylase UbiE
VHPTERFSNRVENYIKYRPGYPQQFLETLQVQCALMPHAAIADIGSGTGILAGMFLENGNAVYGVEPNREMREAAELLLRVYPRFTSVEGKAEATSLSDASVDFVTAGQALHWFDLEEARNEFRRILKPGGWIVVVWNDRRDESPFMQAYRQLLLRHSTDYLQVDHKRITPDVLRSFYGREFQQKTFDNHQEFDFDGIRGRLLSSSYVPLDSGPMLDELRVIFAEYQVNDRVRFEYDTTLYYGQL